MFCSTSPARREERGFGLVLQITSGQLCRPVTAGDAVGLSALAHLRGFAAGGSDVSRNLPCPVLAGYVSVFSVIKENNQWMSAVGNRG